MKRWQTFLLFSVILTIWISMLILPISAKAQRQGLQTPVQAPVLTKQVSIQSVAPKSIILIAGGQEVAVTITGANVNQITAVQVIQEGKLALNFETRLGALSTTSMTVHLKAKPEAKLGSYQLRIIAGAQSIDIPTSVVTLEAKASSYRPTASVKFEPVSNTRRDWRLSQQNSIKVAREFQNYHCCRGIAIRIESELKSSEKTMTTAEQLVSKKPINKQIAGPTVEDLGTRIKILENLMEEVRNKRQECQTAFENFDQKVNQLFNLLSTVLKNEKEMQEGIVRNML